MTSDHGHAAHEHSYGPGGHAHAPVGSRAFAISVGLNVTFVVVEVVAGLLAHSMALVADCPPAFLRDVGKMLRHDFHIEHSTLQIEPPDAPDECAHAPDDVVWSGLWIEPRARQPLRLSRSATMR